MKKRMFALVVVMALVLAMPIYASTPRAAVIQPGLSFNGTAATCSVIISADYGTDKISAIIELVQGSTCVERWTASSTGDLIFQDTAQVTKGKTYTLNVDAVINGKTYPTASISKKCS